MLKPKKTMIIGEAILRIALVVFLVTLVLRGLWKIGKLGWNLIGYVL